MRLEPVDVARDCVSPSVNDVTKKITARTVVARLKKFAAPLPPNKVWLDPPPNAPARPPPFPDWSRIDTVSAMQDRT
jgi:hypothetical protein